MTLNTQIAREAQTRAKTGGDVTKTKYRKIIFWLSALNLKDIPYNDDFGKTLDRVHVKYVLHTGAFMSKIVATFVQKVGLIWLKGGFVLYLFKTQM